MRITCRWRLRHTVAPDFGNETLVTSITPLFNKYPITRFFSHFKLHILRKKLLAYASGISLGHESLKPSNYSPIILSPIPKFCIASCAMRNNS